MINQLTPNNAPGWLYRMWQRRIAQRINKGPILYKGVPIIWDIPLDIEALKKLYDDCMFEDDQGRL